MRNVSSIFGLRIRANSVIRTWSMIAHTQKEFEHQRMMGYTLVTHFTVSYPQFSVTFLLVLNTITQ